MSVKAPFKQSPLAHRDAITGDGIKMSEHPFLGKVTLRGVASDMDDAVKTVLSVAAPKAVSLTMAGTRSAHWIGPDTLLVCTSEEDSAPMLAELQQAMSGKSGQVADVSNYYTTIEISGEKARAVLQKLSTLDLHPSAFGKGDVRATKLAHSNVVISAAENDMFFITIRWSHADYFWCLLANAGYEFGLPKQTPLSGEIVRQ